MSSITIYYDVVSPYSYLGFQVMARYQTIWKIKVNFEPALLGAIMHASKNQPPGTNPYKGRYMMQDIQRASDFFGVPPMRLPDVFPSNSLPAQRLLTAIKLSQPEKLIPASLALWKMYWQDNKSFSDDDIKSYLQPIFGQDYEGLVAKSTSAECKDELKATTDKAIASGAFGAPWFICEKDGANGKERAVFFGSDRFESIAFWFGLPWYGPTGIRPNKL